MTESRASRPSGKSAGSRAPASVEELCQEFLQSTQNDRPPVLEQFLMRVSEQDRSRLLRSLLIIEVRARRQAGEAPQPKDYFERFPTAERLIEDVFELLPERKSSRSKPPAELPAERERPRKERAEAPPEPVEPPRRKPREALPEESPTPAAGRPKVRSAQPRRREPEPEPEDDYTSDPVDFGEVDDQAASAVEALPPPVVGKKKKKTKKEGGGSKFKKRRTAEALPPAEFAIPLTLFIVGCLINLVLTLTLVPEEFPRHWYVGLKLGYIVFSTVVTTGALFVAAAVLETSYGYVHTGVLKVAAICLTQAWVADALGIIKIPYFGGIIAWVVTFTMFKCFFDLEGGEVIRSMFIVRIAHYLGYTFVFLAILGYVHSDHANSVDGIVGEEHEADAGEPGHRRHQREPLPAGPQGEYLKLTQKFGDALLSENYPGAYALLSNASQQKLSLEAFTQIQKKARAEYGQPLRCEAGTGTISRESLRDEIYAKYSDVPADIRRAWMHATFDLEMEEGERCYECWMLIVDEAATLKIGHFIFEWCD